MRFKAPLTVVIRMSCDCDSCPAGALAAKVREAKALLDAINVGGLLRQPARAAGGESKYVAGDALLQIVHKRLTDGLDDARRLPPACYQPGGPSVLR